MLRSKMEGRDSDVEPQAQEHFRESGRWFWLTISTAIFAMAPRICAKRQALRPLPF